VPCFKAKPNKFHGVPEENQKSQRRSTYTNHYTVSFDPERIYGRYINGHPKAVVSRTKISYPQPNTCRHLPRSLHKQKLDVSIPYYLTYRCAIIFRLTKSFPYLFILFSLRLLDETVSPAKSCDLQGACHGLTFAWKRSEPDRTVGNGTKPTRMQVLI
jgi:hypothetical protein